MIVSDTNSDTNYLVSYTEKARQLENQLHQINTPIQLNELAQEVATYHRILSAYLMSKDQADKQALSQLLQKFSQLETEVLIKFYRSYKSGRRTTML